MGGKPAIIVPAVGVDAYSVNWFFADFFHPGNESAIARTEEVLYLLIVTLLTASAMAYLLVGSVSIPDAHAPPGDRAACACTSTPNARR